MAEYNYSSRDKITEYETFLNEVLREDLKKVLAKREQTLQTLNDYIQLETLLNKIAEDPETFADGITTKVDLGSNFYVQARVDKSDYIMINIGLGFYAELTIEEARKFINQKKEQLEDHLSKFSKDSAKIKAHIKLILEGLREIQGISAVENM